MFLAQAIRKSGLGQRIAYVFISAFGGSPLGLAYSLVFSEFLLSPIIPSVAARAGGIVLPLVKSLSEACGSRAGDGAEGKLDSYLHTTVFHTAAVSSAMFLTANHPNPLSAKLAEAATNMVPMNSLALSRVLVEATYPVEIKDEAEVRSERKSKKKFSFDREGAEVKKSQKKFQFRSRGGRKSVKSISCFDVNV
ncbi:hypothetical protein BSKO_05520 [Bryopsis sp. KO-2023]|nr:hypothetical protein BSKO_05520 [Bryopsis sp. KO-2023]